MENTL